VTPRNLALLVLGVVAVSFSAILIRLAEAPAITVALYRNGFAAGLLVPVAVLRGRGEFRSLSRRDWALCALSGLFLAAHFATWIPSLSYTTVAASTALVTTQPVWVALGGYLVLRERLGPVTVAGIAVAFAGALVVSGGDFGVSGRAVFGDALALVGAVTAGAYLVSGRNLRGRLSLLTYVAIVYTTCAILLVPVVAAAGQPFGGLRWQDWVLMLLMALVPQIMGHTVFNYLLGHLEAAVVAVAIMGEPVGATLLALAIFGEAPPWTAVLGGALILAGVYAAITAQARRRPAVDFAPVE
jgi:drug/metabolite transporter (DMT)-like permease